MVGSAGGAVSKRRKRHPHVNFGDRVEPQKDDFVIMRDMFEGTLYYLEWSFHRGFEHKFDVFSSRRVER